MPVPAPAPADPHAATMKNGMELLYTQHKAVEAAAEFRKVLAEKQDHYGANYQFAIALDQIEKRAEPKPLWEKVQKMAIVFKDDAIAKAAYERLASKK